MPLRWRGAEFQIKNVDHETGYSCFGDDGFIYMEDGTVMGADLTTLFTINKARLFPAIGGSMYLALNDDGRLTVLASGQDTPITTWTTFPGWLKQKDWLTDRSSFPPWKRVTFVPLCHRAAFVPPTNDQIIVKYFDLEKLLKDAKLDYLLVTSSPPRAAQCGTEWRYTVRAVSSAGKVTFRLDHGPPGMVVDTSGVVSWAVPILPGAIDASVILRVTDASDDKVFQTFSIDLTEPIVPAPSDLNSVPVIETHMFEYEKLTGDAR